MRKAILMMLLAVVSNSAVAEWVKLYSNNNVIIYIDIATVHDEGSSKKTRYLNDFVKPENISGRSTMSAIYQNEIDCIADKSRFLSVVGYSENMGKGATLFTIFTPSKWNSSKGIIALEIACVDMNSNSTAELVGIHVDYLVASLGQPQRSTPLADGGRLLEYRSMQTANTTDNDISTLHLNALQNELKNNNAAFVQLNERLLANYDKMDVLSNSNSILSGLAEMSYVPDLRRDSNQLSTQMRALSEANNQILQQLNLEKQMAMNSQKQQVRSCSKLFTVSLQGNITDARCL